ncbi:MAG: hypothetical protein RL120_08075 [Gammaproteobacteria bacterium]
MSPAKKSVNNKAMEELQRILRQPYQDACNICKGSGRITKHSLCPKCQGSGQRLLKLL